MHKNLIAVQEKMVENARESLQILEVEDPKYLILAALAVAEKPLSEQEIGSRIHSGSGEVRRGLDDFIERGVVMETGDALYEFHPEIDKVLARNVQTKIEALRKSQTSHLAVCEKLLESGRAEYDLYDTLMSRFLWERIAKMRLIAAIMSRRNALLQLMQSGDAGSDEITKIAID